MLGAEILPCWQPLSTPRALSKCLQKTFAVRSTVIVEGIANLSEQLKQRGRAYKIPPPPPDPHLPLPHMPPPSNVRADTSCWDMHQLLYAKHIITAPWKRRLQTLLSLNMNTTFLGN